MIAAAILALLAALVAGYAAHRFCVWLTTRHTDDWNSRDR